MDDDPATVRLRDAVGTLRALYATTRPRDTEERAALRRAGAALAAASQAAASKQRDKTLRPRLRTARAALLEAVRAAPWAERPIRGVLALLKPLGGGSGLRMDDPQRPPPARPWWGQDTGSNSDPAGDDEGA